MVPSQRQHYEWTSFTVTDIKYHQVKVDDNLHKIQHVKGHTIFNYLIFYDSLTQKLFYFHSSKMSFFKIFHGTIAFWKQKANEINYDQKMLWQNLILCL